MRLHRIHIKSYRGIRDREIRFKPTGVTVVEGPNEAGKSSIAEALDHVLSHPDTTTRAEVRSAKPVHSDEGPEVEVEIETGPYRFVLFKRFLKRPATVLTISAPEGESLTGREAHDRVQEMLEETVDRSLWDALRVVQGSGVGPVELSDSDALTRALDRAAGQQASGDQDRGVFEAVEQEYRTYFTKKRGERKLLEEAHAAVARASRDEEVLAGQIHDLEDLVETTSRLDREIADLGQRLVEAREKAERRQEEYAAIEKKVDEVSRLEQEWQHADERVKQARRNQDERRELVRKVEEAEAEVAAISEDIAAGLPELEEAGKKEQARARELEASREIEKRARDLRDLRTRDLSYHQHERELSMLAERRDAVREAGLVRAEAEESLERTRITDGKLKKIREVDRELATAEARLEAGSPRLRVTALGDVALELGGRSRTLGKGDDLEEAVTGAITLRIPGVADVEVEAGTSLDELKETRREHREKLERLLAAAGVEGLEEAERANADRKDARRTIQQAGKDIDRALGDHSLEEIEARIETLTRRVESDPDERPDGPGMPQTLDAASELAKEAEAVLDEAAAEVETAVRRHSVAASRREELAEKSRQLDVDLKVASRGFEDRSAELAAARRRETDRELEETVETLALKADGGKRTWKAARRELDAMDAETSADHADNARKTAERLAGELKRKEGERENALGKLELLGERGLYDAHAEARSRLARAERRERTLMDRARAAELLYEVMRRKRDETRRAYVAPLRSRVVQLGRYIFDASFDVALDEQLSIVSRTLLDRTLPFESLSVGTQEQLGLILRLACAQLVDESEGVPLILDDTLGHTDPSRLDRMGTMLDRAGRDAQIIILTCTPGRFGNIGGADVVDMP